MLRRSSLVTAFFFWLPVGVITTLLCGLIYFLEFQHFRLPAYDPQVQLAEDIAASLSANRPLESVVSLTVHVDLTKSLAPFANFYDSQGRPEAGTGFIDNAVPSIPAGVFKYTTAHGEDRITWQPRPGIRQAIVVKPYKSKTSSGFVVVGRSLREVEQRERILFEEVAVGLLFLLVISFLLVWLAVLQLPHLASSGRSR
ncbi:hypothetical protein M1116_02450 [Patescibacteria group bacterium]|nr:hypothetical protein [Patescibacteria group bacterium]